MTLNRTYQPDFKTIDHIDIPIPEKIILANGIETFLIEAGTQDVIKIDIFFNAGSWYQPKPVIASTVNEMLIEGTRNLTSKQIAEKLDFYGAFIHAQPTKDFGNVSLYTLKKYLPETIKILDDIIKNPTFPEDELSIFLNKRKQKFQIEIEKVSHIARREFNEQLFGKNHPYGIKADLNDYDNISRQDIVNFHSAYYCANNCKIIISGKVDDSVNDLVNQHFGSNDWKNDSLNISKKCTIESPTKLESFIPKEDVTQSAIRLGKVTINKDHPDFHKLEIVNTILGGYFGSRLMKTIREEKGYTYGINSVLVSFKHAGYFVILSEVGADVAKAAIEDSQKEIKRLREETISRDELALVKNYMLGDLLRSLNGAFEIASSFKSLIEHSLNLNFFNKQMETIQSITPDEIRKIADKYLHEDTLVKTIAGKYN
ncbi:MAG: insulinase family protein [Bacteroidetes bacterium]|nr:insulinase family protein [Bacteroidota bacterium]